MTSLLWFVGLPSFLWLLLQLYRAARGPRRNRRHTLPPPTKDARSSIDEHWRIVGRG